jgi:hypothetical protein
VGLWLPNNRCAAAAAADDDDDDDDGCLADIRPSLTHTRSHEPPCSLSLCIMLFSLTPALPLFLAPLLAMANRTIIVDNNTWNTSHIATVGRAMSSPEAKAWRIYRSLDVEYVFVVFGGLIGYSSDDINKFLWCVGVGVTYSGV